MRATGGFINSDCNKCGFADSMIVVKQLDHSLICVCNKCGYVPSRERGSTKRKR